MKKIGIGNSFLEIPTYAWSGKDREAPFAREFTPRGQPIYPYKPLEHLSNRSVPGKYRCVTFENEFLRLVFLPDLNGRLYSAFDKVNKHEMFYKNPQMKPAFFGLRGAWCATGVEYNFPNSHSVTTLEPVMTEIREHRDGSASFVCGDCERVGRMLWSVEVMLRPGSACIEMVSRFCNCTDYPRRFYYWLNAAVPVYPETRFIYPGSTLRLYTHPPMDISKIAYLDYPVHGGRDISVFKSIPQHFPVFAEEMEEDFFGVYHAHLKCGLIHLADHSAVRGRKIWMFGNARDGKMWIDRLTDSGVDYCELQSGPFTLQSDYRLLPPGATHVQRDLWIPVGDTGGFNAVSEKVAANVLKEKEKIRVRMSASSAIAGKLVVTTPENTCAYKKPVRLAPLETKEFVISSPEKPGCNLEVLDNEGRKIFSHLLRSEKTGKRNTLPEKAKCGNRYLEGLYWEEQGWYDRAYGIYAVDNTTASSIAAARMDMDSGLWKKALASLDGILLTDGQNAKALLYSGICMKKLGDYPGAEKRFSKCCDNAGFIGNALLHMAQISIMRKDYGQAVERLELLEKNNGLPGYGRSLLILALRKNKNPDAIPPNLSEAEKNTPFEPLATGEMFFHRGAGTITSLGHQNLIEILCRYMNLGEYADALEIVQSFITGKKSEVPALVWYYRAYMEHLCGEEKACKKSLDSASGITAEWDLVSREESETVLRYVLEKRPGNADILYHLGNLCFHKRRRKEALEYWKKVRGPLRSLALRNEGLYWWKTAGDKTRALRCYGKAVHSGSCGAKTLLEYDLLLAETGDFQARLKVLTEKKSLVEGDPRLLQRKADALLAAGRAEEALEILTGTWFSLCEGKLFTRLLFEDACRQLGEKHRSRGDFEKALEYFMKPLGYPENMSVGKPAANMECEWYWRCGMLCREKNDDARAQEFFRKGAERGASIEIDFFPLKRIVWQHDPPVEDMNAKKNDVCRKRCLKMLRSKIK